jgi:amino acid transporter
MQSNERRDEKTLQIFSALLLFVGVVGGGAILLLLAHVTLGLGETVGSGLFMGVIAAAAALAIAFLVRSNGHR